MRSLPIQLLVLSGTVGCAVTEAEPETPSGALQIKAVAHDGPDDWFEVVNTSEQPLELDDFAFVDDEGDLERAFTFPNVTLAPGASHVQRVTRTIHGFQLGRDESLWIYRTSDGTLADAKLLATAS